MTISIRFAAAAVVAVVGLSVGFLATDHGAGGFGAVRTVPLAEVAVTAVSSPELSERLAAIRRDLMIRPDQASAWQHYSDVMISLDRASHDFEQRVARGAVRDDGSERARHTLVLAVALSDLKDSLAPEQFFRARPLVEDLAGTVICKGLASR